MYEEYEKSMERLARILRRVKKGCLIALAVLIPAFLFCFGVGFRYRDLTCESVTYGELPKPSSGISAIGSTVYEYREVITVSDEDDDDYEDYEDGKKKKKSKKEEYSDWSETVPIRPGTYEVRAHSVSFLGVERDSDSVRFQIRPKKLTIRLSNISVMGDPEGVTVTEKDYSVEGLVYGDRLGNCEVIYSYGKNKDDRQYRLGVNASDFIVHKDDTDASDCYTIPNPTGKITDERVYLTVRAGSKTYVYDGIPKEPEEYDHCDISGKLKNGHHAEFHTRKVAVDSHYAINEVIQKDQCIFDEDGKDVTYQYVISYEEGELTVRNRKITLTSGSASKEYDGTPLTNAQFSVGGEGLAPGDHLDTECIGSQTEVGKSPNYFDEIRIISDTYGDVSEYYDVTEKKGTLRVYAPRGGSGGGGMGGMGGSGGEEGDIESAQEGQFSISRSGAIEMDGSFDFGMTSFNPAKVFSFFGLSNRRYYFREWTYGVYDGSTWYKTEGEDAYQPWSNYLTGEALLESDGLRDSVSIRDLKLDHKVYPYYMTRDPIISDTGLRDYTCETYVNPYSGWMVLPVCYDEREREYSRFVYETYLEIDPELSSALRSLGEDNGIYEGGSVYDMIEQIARYIQGAASYDLAFDDFPEGEDMVLYFLTVSKRGICQHYASAATMMYRAYGIPARFVLGFTQSGQAGRWTTVTTNCGHAWVEVYIDGTGWVPVEVTGGPDGSLSSGTISGGDIIDFDPDEYRILNIAFDSVSKEYDGNVPGEITMDWHLLSGLLRDGDRIEGDPYVLGPDSQYVDAGLYTFDEVDVRVVDSSGADVSYEYVLAVSCPELNITQRNLSLLLYADSIHDTNSLRWRIISGSLVNGHELHVFLENDESWDHGFAMQIGTVGNRGVFAEVLDESGYNVTENYAFGYRYLSDQEWYQYYNEDDDWY